MLFPLEMKQSMLSCPSMSVLIFYKAFNNLEQNCKNEEHNTVSYLPRSPLLLSPPLVHLLRLCHSRRTACRAGMRGTCHMEVTPPEVDRRWQG